jgi:hypothetical protein
MMRKPNYGLIEITPEKDSAFPNFKYLGPPFHNLTTPYILFVEFEAHQVPGRRLLQSIEMADKGVTALTYVGISLTF